MSETTDTPDADETGGVEDFDAFWSGRQRRARVTTIMGERITLPPSLPLQFEMEARRLQRSKRDTDVRKLVGILFGEDSLERWSKAGMDLEQFMVLLAWAPRAIEGDPVTLAEVADEVAKRLDTQDEDGEDEQGEA